jgi:hypothetical protein
MRATGIQHPAKEKHGLDVVGSGSGYLNKLHELTDLPQASTETCAGEINGQAGRAEVNQ